MQVTQQQRVSFLLKKLHIFIAPPVCYFFMVWHMAWEKIHNWQQCRYEKRDMKDRLYHQNEHKLAAFRHNRLTLQWKRGLEL